MQRLRQKTRRYTICNDDVIYYMIDRELHPEVYRAPDLWYQGRSGYYTSRITYLSSGVIFYGIAIKIHSFR